MERRQTVKQRASRHGGMVLGFFGMVLWAGCGGAPAKNQPTRTPQAWPPGLFVIAPSEGALGVIEAKAKALEGQKVVLRGRVAGSRAPFSKDRAIMDLADLSLAACNERQNDRCPTPWDLCCAGNLKEGRAIVQVDGPDGQPLKAGLEGAGGLKPLSQLTVEGVVGPRPDPNTFVIHAARICVEKDTGAPERKKDPTD